MLLGASVPLCLLLSAGCAIEPAVLYSFEDLTDPTVDSRGRCNLTVLTT